MKNTTKTFLHRIGKRPKSQLKTGLMATFCLLFLCLGLPGLGVAQQRTVTGTVTDVDGGLPLPGLTVLLKGTTTGTVSDSDGKYSINVSGPQDVLVFSYIGYEPQEITVGNQSTIDVVMSSDISSLNEVVVVGYGTQKKGNLTGAVGMTDGEVLQNRPITNITDGLQGVVPGLNITPGNGAPGSGASINIRGATSINGGSPLVLVDGAQMNINNINPQDIESVTVLKDAASAAIYGARAAFGVILITTKKGSRNSKPQFNYSGNFFAAQPTIIPDKADSYKYALYINSMRNSTGASTVFNDEHLGLIQDRVNGNISNDYTLQPSGTAYYEHANTDWADLVFANSAPGQNHNLSVSGGSEKTAYRASFAYAKQEGIVKIGNDFYERFNFNTNMSTDLNNWLTTKIQVNFSKSEQDVHNLPPGHGPSIFHTVWRARPILTPYFDLDGVPYATFIRLNPVATLEQGGRDNQVGYNLNTKAGVEMKFGDFQVFSNFTYNPKFRQRVLNNFEFQSVTPWANTDVRTDGGPSYIRKINEVDNYYAFDLYGKYGKDWVSGHSFEATVGFNQEKATFSDDNVYNTELISYDVISISNTLGDPTVTDNYTDWALRSGFARLNYNYMGKYLLEVNGRYDGSSRFAKDDRYGFFPSVSAGWRVTDEEFMKDLTWLNLFKLRASYGALGNQNSSGLYPYVGYTTVPQTNWIIDGSRPLGLSPMNPIAASRTWETVATTNFGVDLVILQGKLDASLDVFTRKTMDMLVAGDALPGVFGAAAPQKNAADLEVKGWEASIGWNDQVGTDFTYNLNLVVSDTRGKITKFDNPTNSLSRSYYEGMTIGEIWGYETVGLFQSQEEIDNAPNHAPLGAGNLVGLGDVHFADRNEDGVINTGENTVENPGDRRIIGNASPRYSYGIRGGASWKGFDLSVFFQGVAKRDYWVDGPLMFGGDGGYGNAVITDDLFANVWSDGSDGLPVNTDAFYFRPSQGGVVNRNKQVQTRYLQDASYLRLKNLTLGYSLPNELLDRVKVNNLRVFVSGENLLTFTKLNSNFDPEALSPSQGALGNTSFSAGGNQSGKLYPLSKRVSFGLTVGF
ncbi:SusC/RagA family TonB-linked outer membrane protein [Algoriphagus halophytocola]|uniref:TonB-dependent receptor n=1 Tax=Algoriphagus halophytocola TaxID=2991499 RepID=A0ABY6MKT9_9BACT|nr:TonB-dependent receptor [Algoriphagus sp. TR-M5]UZD24398.1 TonB-dependent receptor [Algoriphagus sp. TR-M5]